MTASICIRSANLGGCHQIVITQVIITMNRLGLVGNTTPLLPLSQIIPRCLSIASIRSMYYPLAISQPPRIKADFESQLYKIFDFQLLQIRRTCARITQPSFELLLCPFHEAWVWGPFVAVAAAPSGRQREIHKAWCG